MRDEQTTLVEVLGTLNADNYIKIFEENLIKFEEIGEMIFQQDLAPCRRTNKTLQYLAYQETEVLNWMAISLDINPKESF